MEDPAGAKAALDVDFLVGDIDALLLGDDLFVQTVEVGLHRFFGRLQALFPELHPLYFLNRSRSLHRAMRSGCTTQLTALAANGRPIVHVCNKTSCVTLR